MYVNSNSTTDVTSVELETLSASSTSNADTLHTHENFPGQYYSALNTVSAPDTTPEFDWDSSNVQTFTMASGAHTATFSNGNAGARYLIKLIQPGSGSGTMTWPGTVKWPGGTAPTLSSSGSKVDVLAFMFDGTNYYGQAALDFS